MLSDPCQEIVNKLSSPEHKPRTPLTPLTGYDTFNTVIDMKTEKIERMKKRFPREWLLIAVDKFDKTTTTPVSGKVIAHSPHREDIYQILLKPPKIKKLLVEYSEDSFPKGYAAAF